MTRFAIAAISMTAALLVSSAGIARPRSPSKKAMLEEKVRVEIERTLSAQLQLASLSLPDSLGRHAVSSSVVSLQWRRAPQEGSVVVQVLVHSDSGRVEKGWARLELVRLDEVLVAVEDLQAGNIINAGQLKIETRPRLDGQEIELAPTFVVGARVLVAVAAGDALLKGDVSMPIPVERGAPVRVMVRRGGVVVGSTGILENKTLVGAPTRVRVAGKLMAGRLVQSDLVELGE